MLALLGGRQGISPQLGKPSLYMWTLTLSIQQTHILIPEAGWVGLLTLSSVISLQTYLGEQVRDPESEREVKDPSQP